MKRFFWQIPVLGILGVCSQISWASYDLFFPEDTDLFRLHILEQGESDNLWGVAAQGTVDKNEINSLYEGLDYWARILAPQAANTNPIPILIFPSNAEGAAALSVSTVDFDDLTFLASALTHEDYESRLQNFLASLPEDEWVSFDDFKSAAIQIGTLDWSHEPLHALPGNGDEFHLPATIVHELTHALGILTQVSITPNGQYAFMNDYFGLWGQGLRDSNGKQAESGMTISIGGTDFDGDFVLDNDTYYSGVYFTGNHVQEVLGEGTTLSFPEIGLEQYEKLVPGLPVNGAEFDFEGKIFFPELSHIELQNGLLSHQNWRNWTIPMEAELAALQDVGLKFDRKQLFGYSIYASGSEDKLNEFTNTNGYYARENGQWLVGTPNETRLGIGLHIYGSYNKVTQAADILTVGEDAVGIRVEGVENHLTIDKNISIKSDGPREAALLVSYGRDHTINLEGDVSALGEQGIAARFDFGDNILGNGQEYRGSWLWQGGYATADRILSKINGPLVKVFNVSGSLRGREAAIYIDESAFVEEINILSGATLEGDIISKWDPNNPKIHSSAPDSEELYTSLTFGYDVSDDGTALQSGDSDFSLNYAGNINGPSIDMTHKSGDLTLSGKINVHSLQNEGFLTLTGKDVSKHQVTVEDTFINTRGATLETGFDAGGHVNSIQADSAELEGTLLVRPVRDFYASEDTIELQSPVDIQGSGALKANMTVALAEQIDSPTLSFAMKVDSFTDNGSMPSVFTSRSDNAYSQYALDTASRSTGHALDFIADKARGDMQDLLEALDWSAPDGSDVADALKRLGPGAYDVAARASLIQQNEINLLVLRRLMATQTDGVWAEHGLFVGRNNEGSHLSGSQRETKNTYTWQFWVTPYGGSSFQDSHKNISSWKSKGVGLIVGADRHLQSDLDVGFHLALVTRRTHVKDNEKALADTTSAFFGLQAIYAPDSWNGLYLTGQGRIGVENGKMDRTISINGYNRQAESRWTGLAGSLQAGLGWDAHFDFVPGRFTMGPLAFVEYAFLHRPSLDEDKGGAANLDVDDTTYDSLLMNLGLHAGLQTILPGGNHLKCDVLAAWRHELLDPSFATSAAFVGYGAPRFESDTDLPGRDSLLLQAGFALSSNKDFTAKLDVGGEFFRQDYTGMNIGLDLSWQF